MKWIAVSIVVLIALVAIGVHFSRRPKGRHAGSDDDDGTVQGPGGDGDGNDGGDAGGGD